MNALFMICDKPPHNPEGNLRMMYIRKVETDYSGIRDLIDIRAEWSKSKILEKYGQRSLFSLDALQEARSYAEGRIRLDEPGKFVGIYLPFEHPNTFRIGDVFKGHPADWTLHCAHGELRRGEIKRDANIETLIQNRGWAKVPILEE